MCRHSMISQIHLFISFSIECITHEHCGQFVQCVKGKCGKLMTFILIIIGRVMIWLYEI